MSFSIACHSFGRSGRRCNITHTIIGVYSDAKITVFVDYCDDGYDIYHGEEYFQFRVTINKDTRKILVERSPYLDFPTMSKMTDCVKTTQEKVVDALPKLSIERIMAEVEMAANICFDIHTLGETNIAFEDIQDDVIMDVNYAIQEIDKLVNDHKTIRGFYVDENTHQRCPYPANILPELTVELDFGQVSQNVDSLFTRIAEAAPSNSSLSDMLRSFL